MTQVLTDRATLELVLRTLNRLRYDNDSAMAEEGFHEAAEALRAALANAEPTGWQPLVEQGKEAQELAKIMKDFADKNPKSLMLKELDK